MAHWFETDGSRYFRNLSKDHKRDLTCFEGNAQGFRILTQTENHLFVGGLRVTYATLGTFLKYPWSSRAAIAQEKRKFGAYISEEEILERVAKKLGLVSIGKHAWCRHPLAYLVEAADDVCYAIIDLEDAVELKILSYDSVAELLLSLFERDERARISDGLVRTPAHRVNLARLRGPVFDRLIQAVVEAFSNGYEAIMAGQGPTDLFGVLDGSDPARLLVAEAKLRTSTKVFPDSKKIETELGSYETLGCLLAAFCQAGTDVAEHLKSPMDESPLTWKSERILQLLGDHAPIADNAPPGSSWSQYQCLRRVTDYVSGMTDNYATYISQQLRGMGFAGIQRP
jgi:dGTPase